MHATLLHKGQDQGVASLLPPLLYQRGVAGFLAGQIAFSLQDFLVTVCMLTLSIRS